MSLGVWLRQERERRGLSLRGLEAITGVSHSTIDEIEKNPAYDPGLSTLMKLADGMNVGRDNMLEYAGYPTGKERRPRPTPEEIYAAIDTAIDELNEDARGPARNAKELLASLLRLPKGRRNAH